MPIYGYACQACGHSLDALQKIADAPLVDCPECGKPALERQLSAPRFRLKGQGWYETDFKKDNKRNLAGEGDAAPSDAKGEAKPDARPDGQADSKSGGKADVKPASASADGGKAAGEKPAKPSKQNTGSAKSAGGDKAGSA